MDMYAPETCTERAAVADRGEMSEPGNTGPDGER